MSTRGKGDKKVGGESGKLGKATASGGGKRGGKGPIGGIGKRHDKRQLVEAVEGITKPAIKRCGYRAGVKRMSHCVYPKMREIMQEFMCTVLRDAVSYTEHAQRRTIKSSDIQLALKRQGRPLYSTEGK